MAFGAEGTSALLLLRGAIPALQSGAIILSAAKSGKLRSAHTEYVA